MKFSSSPALPALTDRLRRRARKITGPRQAILRLLRAQSGPLTAREIYKLLQSDCDLVTVYRSLHLLEKFGMVKRFELGPGGARFELLEEGSDGHHHHLVCTHCSEIVEIEDCFPRRLEQKIASRNGFTAVTHKLEFYGLCPRCQ